MITPRIAVLGCGYWGKNLVRNFHALEALEIICDPAESGRATAKQIAPGIRVAGTFEEALGSAAVTAVAISAPAVLHYPLAKAALEADKDIFVEKPLCLHVNEAEDLVRLADQRGKVLMVGHLLQYHPCIETLHALLARGDLGKLHYIISNRLNLGKIRREENSLWSFAPHDLSVILSLVSGQLPEQVRCTGGEYLNQGVADTTLTAMRFAGGIRAHVFVSWLNPFKEQKLTVVGSSGIAVFDDTKPWAEKLVVNRQYLIWEEGQVPTASKTKSEPVITAESEPLRNECRHFIECCAERRVPRTDGREGFRVLSVLQAAQQSLDSDGEGVNPSTLSTPGPARDYFVHPTAVVDAGAVIGSGAKVWHFSHVMKGARIGERCNLGQNVNVDGGTVLGNNVKIQNNVSVYAGTVIEDDVFLGPSCVLTNVSNPRSQINRHSLYEKTTIKRGATIGANATIVCGVTIGRYAFVGAGSVVTKDVPDYALVVGNPARRTGWMSRHGHRLGPAGADGIMRCPETGYRFKETSPAVLRCLDLDEEAPLPTELSKGTKGFRELKNAPRNSTSAETV
jgi:UDP-2-acetamido-3-amino-2,3-dideoxy-glucuronate N-acetyltransferase